MARKPPKGKSLAEVNPELAKQWHPSKNGDLTPYDVSSDSRIKIWWKCNKKFNKNDDHIWKASILDRKHGNVCHNCLGYNAIKLRNDILEKIIGYFKLKSKDTNAFEEISLIEIEEIASNIKREYFYKEDGFVRDSYNTFRRRDFFSNVNVGGGKSTPFVAGVWVYILLILDKHNFLAGKLELHYTRTNRPPNSEDYWSQEDKQRSWRNLRENFAAEQDVYQVRLNDSKTYIIDGVFYHRIDCFRAAAWRSRSTEYARKYWIEDLVPNLSKQLKALKKEID